MNKERNKTGIEKWMFIHSYRFINSYFYQHKQKNLHKDLFHLLITVTHTLPRIFCIFFAYPKNCLALKFSINALTTAV